MTDAAAALSDRVTKAARSIRVLSALTWPEETVEAFLATWRSGAPELPVVEPVQSDAGEQLAELEAAGRACDDGDPIEGFIKRTAHSYATAGRMLLASGTPEFTRHSVALYGGPRGQLPGSSTSHREAAEQLLANTDNLAAAGVIDERSLCLTPATVRARLMASFADFFGDAAPDVVLDAHLASKAAAGSRRVRLRDRTCFGELDIMQLTQHEGFVHTATALNGRAQPVLSCMGLSAPRTTLTQEGLATTAELTTRAIDIARLRRLALRTVAIDAALEGADFIEVFRIFLEAGQSEDESAHSAMRVFRGGDVRGGVAFTKDVVYLGGLIAVHTFLRKAIAESQPHLVRRLFAGRLALADVFRLAEAFEDGRIVEPRFIPEWATDLHRLAAYLAFSAMVDTIDLSAVELGQETAWI